MKTLNRVCQFLALALGLAALALFFTNFATVSGKIGEAGETVKLLGATLTFGSKITVGKATYDMYHSAHIAFCFWLSVIGLVISAFSFKSKGARYFAPGFGLAAGIYMLVIALSKPEYYVNLKPLNTSFDFIDYPKYAKLFGGVTAVLATAICLLLFAVVAAAYLLIDDYIEVMASKGAKKTIFRRIIAFFKDYKSEAKKIVWPGLKDVVKNTLIVLVMCLIVGAFIWLMDWGLGSLIKLVLKA